MMRSLYTSASGMTTQQLNVDVISNNLANVNTVGYKKERLEFQSLLYETMSTANVDDKGNGKPVNMQVGHGVRPTGTVKTFTQGMMEETFAQFDFAIDGKGFMSIRGADGEEYYTRAGNFKTISVDGEMMLVTNDGYPVLSTDDEPIVFDETMDLSRITCDKQGQFMYMQDDGTLEDLGIQLKLVQFNNPQGLEAKGGNLFAVTTASGEAMLEIDNDDLSPSVVMQGFLEKSNVDIVEEMVKMIVGQRAYEINSQAIKTSDEMLQLANQLKR
ncbi:flagellar basal-body rod protein FlgG [Vallitalea okinawensis]|uniref:flagellar basal-body rod protein FlgG n=1 Tax=Vallitalea okinawensis TaxID=2078660 RepID=UPI000CFB707D|nr:flagellar basal-body rod protein FlgG [Vallitalea okinawensis]